MYIMHYKSMEIEILHIIFNYLMYLFSMLICFYLCLQFQYMNFMDWDKNGISPDHMGQVTPAEHHPRWGRLV